MRTSNYELQLQAAERTFLRCDMEKIANEFRLRLDETYLYVPFLGQTHRIRRADAFPEVLTDDGWRPSGFDAGMTLFDILSRPYPVLTGQWCAHQSLNAVQGGTVRGSLMLSPDGLAASFRLESLRLACERLGGTPEASGDYACVLPVFPFFPVLLRYWEADDEFPAQLQFLWDRATPRCLHFETTYYTTHAILTRLKALAEMRC